MKNVKVFNATKVSRGKARGPALVTKERLSFRGFVNPERGTFTGGMGELEGTSVGGSVLIFPCSKGSTTFCMALDLTCRFGNAPAAIINSKIDPFVVLGCVLQDIPLVLVEDLSIFEKLKSRDEIIVDADKGKVTIG